MMKLIYTGWAGLRLAPDLAVDLDGLSGNYGWLFAKHPNGQWVTLANLQTIPWPPNPSNRKTDPKSEAAAVENAWATWSGSQYGDSLILEMRSESIEDRTALRIAFLAGYSARDKDQGSHT